MRNVSTFLRAKMSLVALFVLAICIPSISPSPSYAATFTIDEFFFFASEPMGNNRLGEAAFMAGNMAVLPLTGTTFVNDNWNCMADNGVIGLLDAGDLVRNDNDTVNAGGVVATYGIDGFGTVTTGAVTGTQAGTATINDAIASTNVGGTVSVLEGTYYEMVTVNKTLSLRGAQAGVDARTRTGAESVIHDSLGRTGIFVTANSVEIDGFTVQGVTNANVFGFGIVLGAGTNGSQVRNNIIQNNIAGLSLASNNAANPSVIERNLFRDNNVAGPLSGVGIYTDQFNSGGTLSNVLIESNTFSNNNKPAVFLGSTLAVSQSNVTISNNQMDGNGSGLLLFNLLNSSVHGNTITGSTGTQISIGGGVNGLTVSENVIENGMGRGIRVGDLGGGGTNQNVTVTRNSISANVIGGLEIGSPFGSYTGPLNATRNWWGDISGPTIATNPGGTGQIISDPSGVVDFDPWLLQGDLDADTDGDGVRDFADSCMSTPNPEKIAFVSDRDGNDEIYLVNPDGTGQTRLTNHPAPDGEPAFSRDGSKIVFRRGNEIYVMKANGSDPTPITNNSVQDEDPAFSPDGTKIVFISKRDGNWEIYVMDADGSNQTRLTNVDASDFSPTFSPDGSKIAFASNRSGNYRIYVMNTDGTGQTNVTNTFGQDGYPEFSPDGSKIVFSRGGEIFIMNADGTGQTSLSNNATSDGKAAFSPDGTKIAYFGRLHLALAEIYVMNVDGTNQTRLTYVDAADDLWPAWGPQADSDGDGIGDACDGSAPVANNDGYSTDEDVTLSNNVLANDVDGENDPLTAALVSGPANASSFSLNPDGSFSYAPAANYNGTDSFTYIAKDGVLDSNVATVTITVNSVNDAPVAVNDSYQMNEDSILNLPAPGILVNDSDPDGDPILNNLDSVSLPGALVLGANGSLRFTPHANLNGTFSFTYRAKDGSNALSNLATVTITINPVNDAPIVNASPETQSVQYSDSISPVNVAASDIETPAGLGIAFSYSKDGGTPLAGLPAGMVQGGTSGAWTVSGKANVPAGSYVVTAAVTDGGDGSSPAITSIDTFTVNVTRENAVAVPRLNNPVAMQVGSGGTATGSTGEFCFDFAEVADGSPGNISLIDSASVQINAVGGGSVSSITPSWITFSSGGPPVACVLLHLAGTAPNVFEVTLNIGGGYYTGSGTTAFLVYDPSAGFASGGGWIINPNTGYRANYGVNVKYLKNGNAQGSILYIEHRPDGDYKFKSTSLNSSGGFAIVPITGGSEAQIAGKGNYGVNGVFTGNYSFIARVIDKGNPGTNDQFGFKLITPNGQVMNEFTFNPQLLGGGNNQVPKK